MRILTLLAVPFAVMSGTIATSAAPLDTFTKKQSSVTSGAPTSTRIVDPSRTSPWSARVLSVKPGEICKQGSPSSYAVGTEGTGVVFFQSKNFRGGGEISWELNPALRGRAIGEVRFEVFDASPATSPQQPSLPLTAFVKVENKSGDRYTINSKISLQGATRSRALLFRLGDEFPQTVADSLKHPSRITVGIRRADRCDMFVGLRGVRFNEFPSPSPLDPFQAKGKRAATKQRGRTVGQARLASAGPQNAPSPAASPTIETCASVDTYRLADNMRACSDRLAREHQSTECKEVMCQCVDHPDRDYTVEQVESNIQMKGTACTQRGETCDSEPGLCNALGSCMPERLVDLTLNDYGIVDRPDNEPNAQCIDLDPDPSLLPDPSFICTATVEQITNLFRKVILKPPGTPCTGTDPDGTPFTGVCSSIHCVPSPAPVDECTGKAQCTDCDPEGSATNGACWNGKCLKMGEFEAINCAGLSNPCMECQGVAVCNPDGRQSYEQRSINEGGTCTLRNNIPGRCRRGACVPYVTTTPNVGS